MVVFLWVGVGGLLKSAVNQAAGPAGKRAVAKPGRRDVQEQAGGERRPDPAGQSAPARAAKHCARAVQASGQCPIRLYYVCRVA